MGHHILLSVLEVRLEKLSIKIHVECISFQILQRKSIVAFDLYHPEWTKPGGVELPMFPFLCLPDIP